MQDAVDFIGVDAYWPLTGQNVSSLVGEWTPILDALGVLSARVNRSVVFTELGFPSGSGLRSSGPPGAAAYALQAAQYEAVFLATRNRSWFLGTFWWNWDTDPGFSLSSFFSFVFLL